MNDESKIAAARRRGVAWLCCTCDRYWAARNAGIAGDVCSAAVAGETCGSPLSGLSFPLYQGDVIETSRFCFVCGLKSVRGMKARGSAKVFGVCGAHGPEWASRQQSERAEVLPPEMTHKDVWMPLAEVPRRKSLAEHMLEFDPQSFDPIPEEPQ